jgi:transcriptional regulator with XRE-family HTH domain
MDTANTEQPAISAQALRDRLNLSKGYASDLASGKRKPSLALAVRIERELGIPVAHWVKDASKCAA